LFALTVAGDAGTGEMMPGEHPPEAIGKAVL